MTGGGGLLVSLFRLPALLLVVFVPLKIAADLSGHFRDHSEKVAGEVG